jgi:hypothetical protein
LCWPLHHLDLPQGLKASAECQNDATVQTLLQKQDVKEAHVKDQSRRPIPTRLFRSLDCVCGALDVAESRRFWPRPLALQPIGKVGRVVHVRRTRVISVFQEIATDGADRIQVHVPCE